MVKRTRKSPILLPTLDFCGLCLSKTDLCNSHVLADYMGRWMKSQSATAKFRQGTRPNRTVQDLPKIPLLCEDCEGRIKLLEDQFKAQVFDPWSAKIETTGGELPEDVPLPTDGWMDLHTLSIAWRALHVPNDENRRRFHLSPLAKAANDEWRPALLAGKQPLRSRFWVIQSQRMDQLLTLHRHQHNRAYILLSTHIGSSDTMLGVRQQFAIFRTVNVGGRQIRFNQATGYGIGISETGRGYFLSFVKGYGFCFLGIHTQDGAIASSLDLDGVVAEVLDYSIRQNKEGIDDRLSPKQRAKDEAARKRLAARPTLSMRIREADERERAARKRPASSK